jgi:hypothetical protein
MTVLRCVDGNKDILTLLGHSIRKPIFRRMKNILMSQKSVLKVGRIVWEEQHKSGWFKFKTPLRGKVHGAECCV